VDRGAWQATDSHVLLDSCSDAHLIFDRKAFLYIVPSDIPAILVGKEGESVSFQGMGPALLKVRVEGIEGVTTRGLILDKAYLPTAGHSTQNIISTGRLFLVQGFDFSPNLDVRLFAPSIKISASLRNFSPFVSCQLFDSGGSPLVMNSHMTGQPKKSDSYKLVHVRYAHGHEEAIFRATGKRPLRKWRCWTCEMYKRDSPSAAE
jgi:hypothetical protein